MMIFLLGCLFLLSSLSGTSRFCFDPSKIIIIQHVFYFEFINLGETVKVTQLGEAINTNLLNIAIIMT